MPKTQPKFTVSIGFKVSEAEKAVISAAANADNRPFSQWCRLALVRAATAKKQKA